MEGKESGYIPQEAQEVSAEKVDGTRNFVEGLKTAEYTDQEFVKIRSVLDVMSKEL